VFTFIPEPRLLDSPRRRPGLAPRPLPAYVAGGLPARAQVVVIGTGPAGIAVAGALWHAGVHDLVLLDPAERPCARFLDRVDAIGQRVLRSPYEHHPGVEGHRDCELLDFARLHWAELTQTERGEIRMAQSGHRSVVPLDVFEAYASHVAEIHDVPQRAWQATVRQTMPRGPGVDDEVDVVTDRGVLTARHVVLCLGEERRTAPSSWWAERPASVRYWDEPEQAQPTGRGSTSTASNGRTVVVGAGLTAAHVLTEALEHGRDVAWVMRAAQETYKCADVDATFFRPEGRATFARSTAEERVELTNRHRHASVMFEFRPLLNAAEADGRMIVHRNVDVTAVEAGRVRLSDGRSVHGDEIVLCLGTHARPGGGVLGAEFVGPGMWGDLDPRTLAYVRAPQVHAVGAAAGGVLGPAARNIDGHRVAAERIVRAVRADAAVVHG